MKNFVHHVLETAKMIVFEKGRLIYAMNRPGYRKSLQCLQKKEKKTKIPDPGSQQLGCSGTRL